MIIRLIAVVGLLLAGGATATPTAAAPVAASQTVAVPQADATGWRFRGGNICVLDATGGKLSDGLWRATLAWSKAEDINLIWRRSCAGYSQAQTITVQTYNGYSDWYYGVCRRTHVWTQHGYMKPGLVTRAVVNINLNCNVMWVEDRTYITAHALGLPVGLKNMAPGDPRTVMGCAGLPTARDYGLVEQIYPW